jgi:hypothetical protein
MVRVTEQWRKCHCSRLVPPDEYCDLHGCCDDCYWSLPDSREERFALICDDDRDRLIDESRD